MHLDHDHIGGCDHCHASGTHAPMEELTALLKYMVGHNATHARELAELADQLEQAGSHGAYEQVMAAVSDLERVVQRLADVLAGLDGE